MKLHQLLAVLSSAKALYTRTRTDIYQKIQKDSAFKGLVRTYSSREDEGTIYPSETVVVQHKTADLIENFVATSLEYLSLIEAQNLANQDAYADVVVDGVTIFAHVPVSQLLFLEKQVVTELATFIEALPTLDTDKNWTYDSNRGLYVSDTKETVKTKRITVPLVLYAATKEHPAQVKEVSSDVVEGTWSSIELSGAIPVDEKIRYKEQVNKLRKAIVLAREEANTATVNPTTNRALFDFVFGQGQ